MDRSSAVVHPHNSVDWNKPGGLLCCNWPCMSAHSVGGSYRLIEESDSHLLIEVSDPTTVPPAFLVPIFLCFPVVSCALMASMCTGSLCITSWRIIMRENNLVLEEITKYSCSEVSTIKLGRIRNSVVENKIEFDTQTNRPVLLSRIVVVGHTEEQLVGHTRGTVEETEEPLEQVTTPWRIGEGDTMDNLCQKIFQLIPADSTLASVMDITTTAISNPRVLSLMLRGAVPTVAKRRMSDAVTVSSDGLTSLSASEHPSVFASDHQNPHQLVFGHQSCSTEIQTSQHECMDAVAVASVVFFETVQ